MSSILWRKSRIRYRNGFHTVQGDYARYHNIRYRFNEHSSGNPAHTHLSLPYLTSAFRCDNKNVKEITGIISKIRAPVFKILPEENKMHNLL